MSPTTDGDVAPQELESLRRALAEAQARVRALEAERQAMEQQCQALEGERRSMEQQCQALEGERRSMEQKLQELEHQLKLLKKCLFGSRSEKVSAEELEARIAEHALEAAQAVGESKRPDEPPAEAEEEKPEPDEEKRKKQKRKARPHGRGPLPAHLTRIRVEHPIDPARSVCPHCPDHPPLVKIGEDIRETLHKLPVQYVVHQHVYPKCVCQRCHDGVVMPEGPDNGLKADVTVVADVVVQKYAEHKPLYRQQQAFERVGIPIRRQTLCDWTGWCSDQVAPLVRAIREYIIRQVCVQSDETSVRMQLRDGKMHTARLWANGLPWAEVVFDFRTNKSHHGPEQWLKGGQARYIQADGGSSYGPVLRHLSLDAHRLHGAHPEEDLRGPRRCAGGLRPVAGAGPAALPDRTAGQGGEAGPFRAAGRAGDGIPAGDGESRGAAEAVCRHEATQDAVWEGDVLRRGPVADDDALP